MKYELCLNDTKNYGGHTLYRIRALKDISNSNANISKGDIGGWVESEENLSQDGNCWVGRNACVLNKAKVLENALITDNSVMTDYSILCGDAFVQKNCYLTDHSIVGGLSRLLDEVFLHDYTRVLDRATVAHITLKGNIIVLDAAILDGADNSTYTQHIGLTIEGSQIIGGSYLYKQPFNFANLHGYYRSSRIDEILNKED